MKRMKWIPIITRPLTEEEKSTYSTYVDNVDELSILTCELPKDRQKVLISVNDSVELDIFIKDKVDGCYFEGTDIEDVQAWMPSPDSYATKSKKRSKN